MIAYPIDLLRTRVTLDNKMKKENYGIIRTGVNLVKNDSLNTNRKTVNITNLG